MMKQYTPVRDSYASDVPYHKNVNNYFTTYHNNVYCRPFFRVQEGSASRSAPHGGYNVLSPYRESYRDASVGPLNNFENSAARKDIDKFVSHDELSYVVKRHGTDLYSPLPPSANYGGYNYGGSPGQTYQATPGKTFKSPSSNSGFSPSLSRTRKAGIYPVNIYPNNPRVVPNAMYSSYNILSDDIHCHEVEIPSLGEAAGNESPSKAGKVQKAGISPEKVYPNTPRDGDFTKYSSYHVISDDIRRHQADLVSPPRKNNNNGISAKANGSKQGSQATAQKERSPYSLFKSHHKLDRGIQKHQVDLKSPPREHGVQKKYLDSYDEITGLVSHHAIEISPGRVERVTA